MGWNWAHGKDAMSSIHPFKWGSPIGPLLPHRISPLSFLSHPSLSLLPSLHLCRQLQRRSPEWWPARRGPRTAARPRTATRPWAAGAPAGGGGAVPGGGPAPNGGRWGRPREAAARPRVAVPPLLAGRRGGGHGGQQHGCGGRHCRCSSCRCFFYFFEKLFTECRSNTRQSLCRVSEKKHTAKWLFADVWMSCTLCRTTNDLPCAK